MNVGSEKPQYAELQCMSNFSFLRGAAHPAELVKTAKELGHRAIAIADLNSLAGVVRAHIAAKEADMHVLPACRLRLVDGVEILCLPQNRTGWGRLCRMLTRGKRAAKKGECHLTLDDVVEFGADQIFIPLPPDALPEDDGHPFIAALEILRRAFPENLYLAAHWLYTGDDRRRLARLEELAARFDAPLVATNDVHYHDPARRPLQDVITCIREKCKLTDAGYRLAANAERHLKPAAEMYRLFRGHEDAVARSLEIVARCTFSLDELAYEYPDEPVPEGKSAQQHLTDLTWQGADWRYPDGVSDKVRVTLNKELALIEKLDYAPYFLTVYDIVREARSLGILCQGRGSAANSAVCYCIGITAVDPAKIDLLFERFISEARKEPPDIDVDFEHERREEVIQYIYKRYGRARAGLTATVITYRPRSAVREVGKVMGLSEDITTALAGTVWGSWGASINKEQMTESGLDLADPLLARTIQLTEELLGFPRHLSQHVGGFVLTRGLLEETVPIGNAAMENRTFIEWDKDDIDALGILKIDVLALGMLTCIRKCFEMIEVHHGEVLTLANIPKEDQATYTMLQKADAIGVFQVESRAQMNMLPRLKPERFYDLVIEVAIVRPGPIQGDMVHPYLRRRDRIEQVEYPSPDPAHGPPDELRNILGRTLGVPLFQEQAMQIAIDAAKFTPDEANQLRRSMATFRRMGTIATLEEKMVNRMIARGYDPGFSRRCFDQIKGFGEYGFPESHAASFALLAYISAWIKRHYPDAFCAGLLNSQPMGFYAPAQIVRDAREHGVEVAPADINTSHWDSILEPRAADTWAVRLGFRQIKGVRQDDMDALIAARSKAGFTDIADIRARTNLSAALLERLAAADAFRSIGLDRRQALWRVRALKDAPALPLFDHARASSEGHDPPVILPEMPLPEHVVADYQTMRLSLKAHPMEFLRENFRARGMITTADLMKCRDGDKVSVAGIVLVRQRPGSTKGVVFITLEDETGIANLVVWSDVMARRRKVIMGARLIRAEGVIQRTAEIIHVVARDLENLSGDLYALSDDLMPVALDRADEGASESRGAPAPRPSTSIRGHPRNLSVIPRSRDFH
jgi:error-prone DNA polymerase